MHIKLKDISKPIDCVIFDCDGVLVDSEIIASRVSLHKLKPYGVEMAPQDYARTFAGKVEEDILSILTKDYQLNLPEDFLPKLRLSIEHALDHELKPIEGTKEAIQKIPVRRAVVSNSRLARVLSSLKVAGLTDFFGHDVFAAEMVARPKPAPDVYLHAAQSLQVAPEKCLVVEDSQSGVISAHAAGMQVVAFLAASHIPEGHQQVVRDAGAVTTVDNMQELSMMFEQLFKNT